MLFAPPQAIMTTAAASSFVVLDFFISTAPLWKSGLATPPPSAKRSRLRFSAVASSLRLTFLEPRQRP
jgi:hypothetical protein